MSRHNAYRVGNKIKQYLMKIRNQPAFVLSFTPVCWIKIYWTFELNHVILLPRVSERLVTCYILHARLLPCVSECLVTSPGARHGRSDGVPALRSPTNFSPEPRPSSGLAPAWLRLSAHHSGLEWLSLPPKRIQPNSLVAYKACNTLRAL